jgi:hypothetical protein
MFQTKLDYSNNRQIKQFQLTNTQLSGTTVFGVDDVYIPINFTGDTINIDALQNIRTRGIILPNAIPNFSGTSYQVLGRDNDTGKVVSIPFSAVTSGGTGGSFNDDYVTGATFNELSGLLEFTRQSGGTFNVDIGAYSGGSSTSTGLEAIDEGNGIGWRLIGRNPLAYGNIGLNSIDFSLSTNNTNLNGALGDYSLVSGLNNVILSGVTGSTILGGNIITGTTNDTTYVPNLNITKQPSSGITNTVLSRANDGTIIEVTITEITRLTYSELKALKDANQLIPFKNYIITDYVHKYQINGSNSSNIKQTHEITGSAGLYSQFENVPSSIASNGDTVTAISVPSGATINIGDTFTIIDYFSSSFIRFSPSINSPANYGTIIQFEKPRYNNVVPDETILDSNGKAVIKPNGVINTDVHDDNPYMDLLGVDNPSPITEEINVFALDENTISLEAKSVTFSGDELLYDFDDNTIKDEDGNVITGVTRNGFIIRRENKNLGISIDKDWRNQRYRRYKVDGDLWDDLLFVGDSAPLYTIGGDNFGTTPTNNLEDDHKYLLKEPIEENFYFDFYSVSNTDIFLSGETGGTPLSTISRRSVSDTINQYSKTIEIPISGLTSAKDIHIIPIENYQPKSIVVNVDINELSNTIFRDLNQRYGNSSSIIIKSKNGLFNDCTFNSGGSITNSGNLLNIKSIDNLSIINSKRINNLFNCNYSTLTNDGLIRNVRLCGHRNTTLNNFVDLLVDNNSIIYNTIIGISRADSLRINNSVINRSMVLGNQYNIVELNAQMYATGIVLDGDIEATKININNFNKQIPDKGNFGVKHNLTSINNLRIDDNVDNLVLVNRNTDASFITTITQIGTTQ